MLINDKKGEIPELKYNAISKGCFFKHFIFFYLKLFVQYLDACDNNCLYCGQLWAQCVVSSVELIETAQQSCFFLFTWYLGPGLSQGMRRKALNEELTRLTLHPWASYFTCLYISLLHL